MLQHRRPGRAGRPQHRCYAARHIGARRLACGAFPWQRQTDPSLAKPPRPNERFSRSDIRRIKEQGPTLDDVTITLPNYEYQRDENNATCVLSPSEGCLPAWAATCCTQAWLRAVAL